MAYEKYNKYVPLSEQLEGLNLVPRVQISFNAHARIRDNIREAAKREGITMNEWLCNAVIDALKREP